MIWKKYLNSNTASLSTDPSLRRDRSADFGIRYHFKRSSIKELINKKELQKLLKTKKNKQGRWGERHTRYIRL